MRGWSSHPQCFTLPHLLRLQTEADPGVWALLLEASHPTLATDITYVAGDRVVSDALCKPFSMGRNLFCVHSRKHIDDFPELKVQGSLRGLL